MLGQTPRTLALLLPRGVRGLTTSTHATGTFPAAFTMVRPHWHVETMMPLRPVTPIASVPCTKAEDEEAILARFFAPLSISRVPSSSPQQPIQIPFGRQLQSQPQPPHHPLITPTPAQPAMHAISILKRRRKKMKKHKWKKGRKAVRDSTRYNKERKKKGGVQREKQE
ncbi:hypothetical protein DFJ77DRAFT_442166 [Powellomyces hirtus]|nr:hypothetical protein DFJ77DRAFT_442166 [Powellomyces hirtus]